MEEWRDVVGYEGLYKVSNQGSVKSLERIDCRGNKVKEKILKPKADNGYQRVALYRNRRSRFYSIHRLVANAFIPNTENLPQVNHIDGNKGNNNVVNLEWCTAQENTAHAFAHHLRYVNHKGKMNNRNSKQVLQLDENGNVLKTFPSINEAKRLCNYSISCISMCCNGQRKTAYGYRWAFS